MTTTTGRRAAGATMLALPLAAGLFMWMVAGDVVGPRLDGLTSRLPWAQQADEQPIALSSVDGYELSPLSGAGELRDIFRGIAGHAAADGDLATATDVRGREIGTVLSVHDPHRGRNHTDGALNLRALVRGSSTASLKERPVGDGIVLVGQYADHTVVVWQQPRGFSILAGRNPAAISRFASALEASA